MCTVIVMMMVAMVTVMMIVVMVMMVAVQQPVLARDRARVFLQPHIEQQRSLPQGTGFRCNCGCSCRRVTTSAAARVDDG